MKAGLYALLLVFVFSGSVSAQGYVGLCSDPDFTSNILQGRVGLETIYVVQSHDSYRNFIASRWKLELDPRLQFTIVGIVYNVPPVYGDIFTGGIFNYGSCMTGDVLIVTVNVFFQGLSPECSWIDVVPDPTSPSGSVEVVDCDGYKWLVHCNDDYREMIVNPNGSCSEGGPG